MNSILANTKSNVYTNVSVYGIQGLVYHCKDINHMVSISTDRNKWICSIDRRKIFMPEFLKELLKILVCCTLLSVTIKLTDIIWKL